MGFYTSEIFKHTNSNVCVGGGRLPLQAVSTKHSNSRTKYHRLGRTHAKHKEPHCCVTRSAPTPHPPPAFPTQRLLVVQKMSSVVKAAQDGPVVMETRGGNELTAVLAVSELMWDGQRKVQLLFQLHRNKLKHS